MTTARLLLRSHVLQMHRRPTRIVRFVLGGGVSLFGAAMLLAHLARFVAGQ